MTYRELHLLAAAANNYREFVDSPEMALKDRLRAFVKTPTIAAIAGAYMTYVKTAAELEEDYNTKQQLAHQLVGTGPDGLVAQMAYEKAYKLYEPYDEENFRELNYYLARCLTDKYAYLKNMENSVKLSAVQYAFVQCIEPCVSKSDFTQTAVMQEFLQKAAKECGTFKISLKEHKPPRSV